MTVSLVGAGPGDPGLITVRGLELVRSCDALVHDALVSPELVAEAPEDALVISREGIDQERVNATLVELGRAGLDVVRLKGGDPFVFGRGGEEALVLAEAGIPFEIVPGVSSIAAVPAAALVPVTHRGVADSVTIASGRTADGSEPDYDALVAGGGTIVLFMALARLGNVAEGLIRAGLPAGHPGRGRVTGDAARSGVGHRAARRDRSRRRRPGIACAADGRARWSPSARPCARPRRRPPTPPLPRSRRPSSRRCSRGAPSACRGRRRSRGRSCRCRDRRRARARASSRRSAGARCRPARFVSLCAPSGPTGKQTTSPARSVSSPSGWRNGGVPSSTSSHSSLPYS